MRRRLTTLIVLAGLGIAPGLADAATLQVTLALDGNREIEIPIATPPGEFQALDGSWGRVLLNGSIVAYYVYAREDLLHSGSLTPTLYPNPWYTIVIRTPGAGSQMIILQGAARPLAEGGGVFGGVIVATPGLAFLRSASFTLVSGTLTLTY